MKTFSFCRLTIVAMVALLVTTPSHAATVAAGGLAIIGYNDNNNGDTESIDADSFAVLATEDIVAGTVIYFTNNAWSNTTMQFTGAGPSGGPSPDDESGFQEVTKLTVTNTIVAGSVFTSQSISADFTWDTSSVINGSASGAHFNRLELQSTSGTFSSDEIYIFQSSGTNPLLHPDNFVYLLSFGDPLDGDPGLNDPATYNNVGAAPGGFASIDYGASSYTTNTLSPIEDLESPTPEDNTAVELDPNGGFHDGWFGIKLSSGQGLTYLTNGATVKEWLRFINNSNNWESRAGTMDLPSGSLSILPPTMAPEPSRAVLAMFGLATLALRRRRTVTK